MREDAGGPERTSPFHAHVLRGGRAELLRGLTVAEDGRPRVAGSPADG